MDVVTGLWDSWDGDAFVHDKDSGLFYDGNKLHVLGHSGKHFSVRGPLNVRRSPQTRPILVQAGTSEVGHRIVARSCDTVFAAKQDVQDAREYYSSVKSTLPAFGRSENDLLMMVGLTAIAGRNRQEAQDKFEQLESLIDPLVGLSLLYRSFGDLSDYPLDGPVPPPEKGHAGLARLYYDLAQKNDRSIRDLYKKIAMAQEHKTVVGTAADVADEMEAWVDTGAADGFNVTPTHLPHGINDFVQYVVPELQRRGRFRTEYEGSTLRENLGVGTPESRCS